jgi:hypothetical protein
MSSHATETNNRIATALGTTDTPPGVDRRAFMIRCAMIGAVSVRSGCSPSTPAETAVKASTATPPALPTRKGAASLFQDLDVVKKSKGPVMTVIDEFYKVGPGPSSSHTIGPMRIPYADFAEIQQIATCAAGLGNVERVEVLPFHQMGRFKWHQLGIPYILENVSPPASAMVERRATHFVARVSRRAEAR